METTRARLDARIDELQGQVEALTLEARISFAVLQQMEGQQVQALRKQEEMDGRAKGLQGQVEALTHA
eukprot:1142238-Prymnesium_polylepis.1